MGVLSGALVLLAVALWPRREGRAPVDQILASAAVADGTGAGAVETETETTVGASRIIEAIRLGWRSDPAELVRAWVARRRSVDPTGGILAVLEGIAPALEAGLPPAVAADLAGEALGAGVDSTAQQLALALREAADEGRPLAPVWRSCAEASRSADIGFVAAAWQLSEVTGAPLADAVRRAVASLREANERTRRVHVAVAGPKATVVVLTMLPLTGPAFGLASGLPPAELYLGSPISTAAVIIGLVLIWVGRLWCRRLIASVTLPATPPAVPAARKSLA
jgi:tight adherence protein B